MSAPPGQAHTGCQGSRRPPGAWRVPGRGRCPHAVQFLTGDEATAGIGLPVAQVDLLVEHGEIDLTNLRDGVIRIAAMMDPVAEEDSGALRAPQHAPPHRA